MAVVWAGDGAGAEEILSAVAEANGWTESTVRTLIHRLIGKGALKSARQAGRTVYSALVPREAWVSQESQGLLDRLFGGQVAGLVAHFAAARALAPEDVARLRRLVADLDASEED
jgi:BlaI family transcriptional regulator, penicillinase repressor